MDQSNTPNIFKIANTDYFSFTTLLMPVWLLILLVLITIIDGFSGRGWLTFLVQGSSSYVYLVMLVASVVICTPLFFWRYRLITFTLEEGTPVQGQVTAVNLFRDRGRVYYSYSHQMQKYDVSNAIHRTRQTKSLHQGQSVTIMVDRNNPRRAFIKEIYS